MLEYRRSSEPFSTTNTFSNWTAASTNLSVKMAAPPWVRSVTGKVHSKLDTNANPALTRLRWQLWHEHSQREKQVETYERLTHPVPYSERYHLGFSHSTNAIDRMP
jgi:hypothetical protein